MATPYEQIMSDDNRKKMSTDEDARPTQRPTKRPHKTKLCKPSDDSSPIDAYNAFTRPASSQYSKPPLLAIPLATPDLGLINSRIIMQVERVLSNQEDARGVLEVYRYILEVWRAEIIETRTFITQHIKHHEDLLLTLLGCNFHHSETNSWARIAMFNLNAYSDKMNVIKTKLDAQIARV